MIRAHVRRTVTETVTDYLGGDPVLRGEERTGVYPGIEVVYYDDKVGGPEDEKAHLGVAAYILRPRSGLETLDDVRQRVTGELARLAADAKADPAEPPVLPLDTDALAALLPEIGWEIRKIKPPSRLRRLGQRLRRRR